MNNDCIILCEHLKSRGRYNNDARFLDWGLVQSLGLVLPVGVSMSFLTTYQFFGGRGNPCNSSVYQIRTI